MEIALGQELKRRIKISGMSVQQFADKMYVTKQSVYKWINAGNEFSLKRQIEAGHLLDCRPNDFYPDDPDDKPS